MRIRIKRAARMELADRHDSHGPLREAVASFSALATALLIPLSGTAQTQGTTATITVPAAGSCRGFPVSANQVGNRCLFNKADGLTYKQFNDRAAKVYDDACKGDEPVLSQSVKLSIMSLIDDMNRHTSLIANALNQCNSKSAVAESLNRLNNIVRVRCFVRTARALNATAPVLSEVEVGRSDAEAAIDLLPFSEKRKKIGKLLTDLATTNRDDIDDLADDLRSHPKSTLVDSVVKNFTDTFASKINAIIKLSNSRIAGGSGKIGRQEQEYINFFENKLPLTISGAALGSSSCQ